MTRAVSIDIETMGKSPTSAITSIGAVMFDPQGDWIGNDFHVHISIESCLFNGLTMDADTVLWWLAQSDEARGALVAGQVSAVPLVRALVGLAEYIQADAKVWANGASFDFAILANAYSRLQEPTPWRFFDERCLRTLKGINPELRIEREGVHHNALDDARHQARLIQHILQTNRDTQS